MNLFSKISIAPMMDYTDRHCRYFLRLITRHALLYTEMITAEAIIHGDKNYLLAYDPIEHPLSLQLGGNDPKKLAWCARVAEDFGYDEINLNVGCPSNTVTEGHFGACLMKQPLLVADCIAAMQQAVSIPVTVKTRIGVDEYDSYGYLQQFIHTVAAIGCKTFIIHARKAWLKGLSPKENREIPPLRYEIVYQLKKDFPQLNIILNGGVKNLAAAQQHLLHVDGIMIGREAYHNPYILANVDSLIYGDDSYKIPTRVEIIEKFLPWMQMQLQKGIRLQQMTRHLLGLFYGEKGARIWRRYLSEHAYLENANEKIVKEGLDLLL